MHRFGAWRVIIILIAAAGLAAVGVVAVRSSSSRHAPSASTTTRRGAATTPPVTTLAVVVAPGRTSDLSLQSSGVPRTYRLHRPATAPSGPLPLVIMLHGAPDTGKSFERLTGLDSVADRDGFLVAYPDGSDIGSPNGFGWFPECCNARAKNPVDRIFISDLIDTLVAQQGADPSHVVVVGESVGGIITYDVACQLAGKLIGVVAVSTTMVETPSFVPHAPTGVECVPARPLSILAVHGTKDGNIPYDGKLRCSEPPGCAPEPGAQGYFPGALAVHAWWERLDGCQEAAIVQERGRATISRAPRCSSGVSVVLATVDGGLHGWQSEAALFDIAAAISTMVHGGGVP
jgi:polyhydroxybutyrate depolymerase